jgi:SAM-dependent methyltransferase
VYEGPGPDAIADVQMLPIRAGCADVVFLVAALYLIADTSKVLCECWRILKCDGTLLVFDYNWWVARRCKGLHRFTSLGLARELRSSGFLVEIHRDCVPVRGPALLRRLFSVKTFRYLVYVVSNWIVVSGSKSR